MRLSLAVLFCVGIPEKFHMFQHIIPLFFLFLSFSGYLSGSRRLLLPRTLIRHCDGLGRRGKLDSKRVNVLSSHQASGKKRTDSSIAGASCRNVPPANDERSGKTMGVGGDEEEEESLLMSAKTRVKKSRVASHAMSEVLIGAHHSLPPSTNRGQQQ